MLSIVASLVTDASASVFYIDVKFFSNGNFLHTVGDLVLIH